MPHDKADSDAVDHEIVDDRVGPTHAKIGKREVSLIVDKHTSPTPYDVYSETSRRRPK